MFLNQYVRSRFALACFIALGLITLFFLKYRSQYHDDIKQKNFSVFTPGCRIPDLDPYDPLVHHLVNHTEPISCPALPALTYTRPDGYLCINRTVLRIHYKEKLDYCEYQVIQRPEDTDSNPDNRFQYTKPVQFTSDEYIGEEYLRVACYGAKSGAMIYTNFHATILIREEVEERCKKRMKQFKKTYKPVEVMNMVIVGVDSVSRLNFMRHMRKTRQFLLEELEAVELKGYNKVADNTYVNLVPMFAGKYVEELPWDERMSHVPFDNFTFIWNNYSSNGYRTLYAEDAPNIAIFNYNKAGFHKPPADYYLRPFSLALEDHGALWKGGSAGPRDCVAGKLETERVLDYVYDFESRFKDAPHMSFTFITRLTHEHINKAASADQPYYEFFKRLHDNRLLDNSVVLFYSDHGMRFGEIRQTYVGKMEERLPFLVLALPKHFREKNPDLMAVVRLNAERLTTPFDIYETLKDLVLFREEWFRVRPRGEVRRGYSLLSSEVPEDRTCESAGILPHWCTCHQWRDVSTDDGNVVTLVHSVVTHINTLLSDQTHRCAQLSVHEIKHAHQIIPYKELLRFKQSLHDVLGRVVTYDNNNNNTFQEYQLMFSVNPSGGVFEASVRLFQQAGGRVEVLEISRVNEYGNESLCIDTHTLKKFCYCNTNN